MVDTVFIKGKKVGKSIIRFTDPFWANLYFNMNVIVVDPRTEAKASNPCD